MKEPFKFMFQVLILVLISGLMIFYLVVYSPEMKEDRIRYEKGISVRGH